MCKNLLAVFIPDSIKICGAFAQEDWDYLVEYGYEICTFFFESETIAYTTSSSSSCAITDPKDLDIFKYAMDVSPDDVYIDNSCVYVKVSNILSSSYEVVTIRNVAGEVTIPAVVNSLNVTRIRTYALCGESYTTIVNVSKGISKVSSYAFYYSTNLLIVNLPSTIEAVNNKGFYSLSNCTVYIDLKSIPSDWDSAWYYSIKGYKMNSKGYLSADGNYFYEISDGNVYLLKYLKPVYVSGTIFIPEKIDGKTVYGVRSKCYTGTENNSSSSRYTFVVPSTIVVMENSAIYLKNYGYSTYYLNFASSSDIPATWNSSWHYSSYGYSSSTYSQHYYNGQWELVDGLPVIK